MEDCTITHGKARAEAGGKEAAVLIMRTVLHSDVAPLDEIVTKYLQPATP